MLEEEEESNNRIRELLAILNQGISVKAYHLRENLQQPEQRQFWFDLDLVRLCVDERRPSLSERYNNTGTVVPVGVYVRDVSCVRLGLVQINEEDYFLEIIASENAFRLVFPSSMVRDWFLLRLRALVDATVGHAEMRKRQVLYMQLENSSTTASAVISGSDDDDDDDDDSHSDQENFRRILKIGIEVTHHCNSKAVASILQLQEVQGVNVLVVSLPSSHSQSHSHGSSSSSLTLISSIFTQFTSFISLATRHTHHTTIPILSNMPIVDIAEVRKGSHTRDFIQTKSLSKGDMCLSLLCAKGIYCLEVSSEVVRDVLQERLVSFIIACREE